jgi:arsenate reductase
MPHYNVLFLCTGNSARSIMAEAISNRKGGGSFTAYSAGSHPTGAVRPEAIRQIEKAGLSAANARSKSWDEFSTTEAPHLSFVFTVCDNAAKEVCPLWPCQRMTAHWGIPDPAAVQGTSDEIERAYSEAFQALCFLSHESRVPRLFLSDLVDLFLEREGIERCDIRRCFSTSKCEMATV